MVSVITVTYNSEKSIEKTIQSVLAQSCTDIEYLIIDGESTDRTVKILQGYCEQMREKGILFRIVSEKDSGIYNAMNKGIALASGDIIGFLNSDDTYETDTIQVVADTFYGTNCDLMFADIRIHKKDGSSFIKKARLHTPETSRDWNHPTTFTRAELCKEYPFREMGIHDDYGFFLQMKKQKRKIIIVNKVLANFYLGGVSNRKNLSMALKRIKDRYRYCYRVNGYSRWYIVECILIEMAKMIFG